MAIHTRTAFTSQAQVATMTIETGRVSVLAAGAARTVDPVGGVACTMAMRCRPEQMASLGLARVL